MLHIVDDEEAVRDALSWLASSRQLDSTCYAEAGAFLSAMKQGRLLHAEGDCLLLDVRMPGMPGTSLFDQLAAHALTERIPVIFLTGHGDVPMAVDSLKRGAFDFFEKPCDDNRLIDRVLAALEKSRQAMIQEEWRTRLASLSQREHEVLEQILAGKMNKVIADQLGISMRTVEVHRAHIFEKMGVKTAVELAGRLK